MASSTSVVEGSSMATATERNSVRAEVTWSSGRGWPSAPVNEESASCGRSPLAAKKFAKTSLIIGGVGGDREIKRRESAGWGCG
jgi:hypothetical protein